MSAGPSPDPTRPPPAAHAPEPGALGRARSFGSVAEEYHGARTRYSAEAVAWALEPAGPGPLRVLDLAAGTGLLTAALLAHRPPPVLEAVEPDDGMRAEYVRQAPGVPIRPGTAEDIPAPDGSATAGFDAVVVGTAFHWFDQSRALPEIARVLRDTGVVAALWTAPDDRVEWVHHYRGAARAALSAASRADRAAGPDADGRPVFHGGARTGDRHGIGPHPLFGDFLTRAFRHTELRPVGELVAAVGTYSEVITAPAAERAAAVRATRELLRDRLAAVGPADPDRPDTLAVPVVVSVVRGVREPRR